MAILPPALEARSPTIEAASRARVLRAVFGLGNGFVVRS
jgi:hypothetical protein